MVNCKMTCGIEDLWIYNTRGVAIYTHPRRKVCPVNVVEFHCDQSVPQVDQTFVQQRRDLIVKHHEHPVVERTNQIAALGLLTYINRVVRTNQIAALSLLTYITQL